VGKDDELLQTDTKSIPRADVAEVCIQVCPPSPQPFDFVIQIMIHWMEFPAHCRETRRVICTCSHRTLLKNITLISSF
jgi:hypothetical protein